MNRIDKTMRPRLSLIIGLLLAQSLAAQDVTLVEENASKRVLVPVSPVNSAWRFDLDFPDQDWMQGTGGVGYERDTGYESWIQIPVGDQMYDATGTVNRSCLVRIKFNVTPEQDAAATRLILSVRYDDGFVAYLNAAKVAEANAPTNPSYNSLATGQHEAGAEPESFNLQNALANLRPGENVLALQGFNVSSNSSDFLLTAKLTMGQQEPTPPFESTNLPIVVIDTKGAALRYDQRITAEMGVIDNGPGLRSQLTDPYNVYHGNISIELRGSSSSSWRKKSANFETQDSLGNNLNVSLLGLPEENDWILYGPYIDKSLMRNVLMYRFSNLMGRYASRTRYCEVVVNGEYAGLYVLMEKIKQDKNRVDVAKLDTSDVQGDALTGGYILKIDKPGDDYFTSAYPPFPGASQRIRYQYHDPDDNDITAEQKVYIKGFIDAFELATAGADYADPNLGYAQYIDVDSFIDHFLLNEICKNVDGYRISAFLHKERDSKGGKLRAGPIWDMDLTCGNANYYGGDNTEDWELDNLTLQPYAHGDGSQAPFWWQRLIREPHLAARIRDRWLMHRSGPLEWSRVETLIGGIADTLNEAQARNFGIWSGPGEGGEGFWPVPAVFYTFATYQDEVDYLKQWLRERMEWMDDHVADLTLISEPPTDGFPTEFSLWQNYPNPFNGTTIIEFELPRGSEMRLSIHDVTGRTVRVLKTGVESAGVKRLTWDACDDLGRPVSSGVYFYRLRTSELTLTRRLLVMRQ